MPPRHQSGASSRLARTLLMGLSLAVALAVAPTGRPDHAVVATHASSLSHAELLRADLQKILDKRRLSINIPGATATIIFPDGSRWSGASGRSDLAARTRATRRTSFVIGSITKTFVAALILQLAEEGTLSLEDPLSNWLPTYPNANNISLRQLLSHTSGLHNYFLHPDYSRLVFGRPTYNWAPQEIIDTFTRRPYFAPGTDYRYSNTNYILLGMVAEKAGGSGLGEQIRVRFGQPLGLTRTWFQGDGPPPPGAAKGYLWRKTGFKEISDRTGYRPTRSAATAAWAAGSGVATADDIATWARALYGGDVLNARSLAEMLDFTATPGTSRYGLGVMARTLDGHRLVGHTGSLRGFVAAMWHLPAEGITIVVTTNRGRIDANRIVNALLRRVLKESLSSSPTSTDYSYVSGRARAAKS